MLALKVAGVLFLLLAIIHGIRLIFRTKVTISNLEVPLWLSAIAVVVALLFSWWMFQSIQ